MQDCEWKIRAGKGTFLVLLESVADTSKICFNIARWEAQLAGRLSSSPVAVLARTLGTVEK